MSSDGDLIVEFRLCEDAVARARYYYGRAKDAPWPSIHSATELPSYELLDFGIVGSLQIRAGPSSVFLPDALNTQPSEVTVLLCLFGLRAAISRVAAGEPQEVPYGPDWRIVQVVERGGVICVSTTEACTVCRPAASWTKALDEALGRIRNWLRSELPELRDDPVLGEWVKGGSDPQLVGIADPGPDSEPNG